MDSNYFLHGIDVYENIIWNMIVGKAVEIMHKSPKIVSLGLLSDSVEDSFFRIFPS